MKTLLLAAAALAAMGAAAPAFAQPGDAWTGVTGYGTLGAEDINSHDANVGAVTGRLGARFGQYFGVEGELSGGFNSDHIDIAGTRTSVRVNDQYAAYAVGFLPVMPNADLFARIGYGATDLHFNQPAVGHFDGHVTSWNAGAGAQYFFDTKDGVRAEYTRMTADHGEDLDANVWSLAYVRKF